MRTRKKTDDEMPAELDFGKLGPPVVGKYYERAMATAPVVRLAPDVAIAFPSERAVNAALRGLMRKQVKSASKASRSAKRAAR